MSEAKFAISHNFTTIRGDSYEEFLHNLSAVYGEEDAKSLAAVAFSDLRNHYVGAPTPEQAQQNLQNGLGATVANPSRTQSTEIVALDVPYAQKGDAKDGGAKWDKDRKAWTVPVGHPLTQRFKVKA